MQISLVLVMCMLNGVAVQASRVLAPLYALEIGAGPLMVGLLGAGFALLPLTISVPAGRFADRFGARWLLVIAAFAGGVAQLVPYSAPGLAAVFVASLLMGLTFGAFSVSLQNWVGQLSTPENRARYFGNHSLAASVGNFFGPLVAGYSIEQLGFADSFLHLAWFTLLPALMLVIWGRSLPGGRAASGEKNTADVSLLSDSGVKRMIVASGLLLTAQDLYRIYMPVYGHALGMSPSTIGIVVAALPAASFPVRAVMQWLINRFSAQRLLALSFLVAAACLVLIPMFEDAMLLSAIGFIFGLGIGCSQPIITMLMYEGSPPGRTGEVLGLRMMAVHFTRLVGPVFFGAIGSAAGLPAIFFVNAAMMLAGGYLSRPRDP